MYLMSTKSEGKNSILWICESLTSKQYGFKPFKTSMKRECIVCGFKDITYVHHIIPLAQEGDHCEENVVMLCPNHHKMIHNKQLKEKVRLPKSGKKRIQDTKEIKIMKERDEALLEGASIICKLSGMWKLEDGETRDKLTQNLGYLFEKYQVDYIDCISRMLRIKRESLLRQYVF